MAELEPTDPRSGTLRDFLTVVFRRRWIVLATFGVTLAVVIYLALTQEPEYLSYSKLLVSRGMPTTAFSPTVKLLSWEEELTSEMEAIKSARIYKRAQEILDERRAAEGDTSKRRINPRKVDANTPGKSSIIHILYKDSDPRFVKMAVQALTQAYKEFRTSSRGTDPTGFLQEEIEDLRKEIDEWEEKRAQLLKREQAVQLPDERQFLLSTRRNIETELAAARADVAEKRTKVEWMRRMLEEFEQKDPTVALYAFRAESDRGEPMLIALRRLIMNTQAEYFDARAQYTPDHPKVLALRDRLDELRRALVKEARGYLTYMEGLLAASEARVASMEASLEYVDERLATFPDKEAQLQRVERILASLRTTHDALVKKRIEAMTTRVGSRPWDVVVLEDASEPTRVRTRDYVRIAVVPLFSLLVGIGLAFLLESLDHSLKDVPEAEAFLKVPVLATISRFRR